MDLRWLFAMGLMIGGCPSTPPTPGDTEAVSVSASDSEDESGDEDDGTTSGGGGLAIDCGDLPVGAVDAEYAYTPTLQGDADAPTWTADGLPDGLLIDPSTGMISGAPLESGAVEVTIAVSAGTNSAETTCALTVQPRLEVDLSGLLGTTPGCITPGGSLHDLVPDGTGDASTISCAFEGGSGDGVMPAGITLNSDTCELEGSVTESAYGTWVFIVRGEQNGVAVHAPYCASQETPTGYDVSVTHSEIGGDAALQPIVRASDGGALSVGGGGDPLVEVTSSDACGVSACFFGYAFAFNESPFDAKTINLSPTPLIQDDDSGEPIGFSHELSISGRPRPPTSRTAPSPSTSPSPTASTKKWVRVTARTTSAPTVRASSSSAS